MIDLKRPDADLIDDARRGDEHAFELLMRRHSEAIRRLIAHYLRNRSVVDDLAQETFVKAYFSLSQYRGDAPFPFWLKQIAVRLCLDEMRRRKSQPDDESGPPESYPAVDESAENRMAARLLLNRMIERISPVDRMILLLLYGDGYSVSEIAQMTGLSRANVKIRAFRIRRRLRAQLGDKA